MLAVTPELKPGPRRASPGHHQPRRGSARYPGMSVLGVCRVGLPHAVARLVRHLVYLAHDGESSLKRAAPYLRSGQAAQLAFEPPPALAAYSCSWAHRGHAMQKHAAARRAALSYGAMRPFSAGHGNSNPWHSHGAKPSTTQL